MAEQQKGGNAGTSTATTKDAMSPSPTSPTSAASAEAKKRRGLSAESRLKLALNDVIAVATENGGGESPEVKQAKSLLTTLGFEERPSASKKIAELQSQLQGIDITEADSMTRINEISKAIGKLRKV